MSCSSDVKPLQFTFQNVTLTDDGRARSNGIAVQLGTPAQVFSLTPTTLLNNTFVNNIATCGSETNASCISTIGGGYDTSASSTFRSSTSDAWNGSAENGADAFIGLSAIYFNDVLTVASQVLPGFPLLIQATGANLYAGLGLGKNSTFISRLLEAKLVPSRSWSLYPGMYSDSRAGSLIIGGYADRFYHGQLHTKNLSNTDYYPNWHITAMEYQTDGQTVDLLPNGTSRSFIGVVDSYYPTLTVPDETLWKWGNATNGTWSPEDFLYTYDVNNVPTGNITVTLNNGLTTTIPNEALFDPPAYDNGLLSSVRNGTDNTIYSVFQPWDVWLSVGSTAKPTDSAILGVPYAAMVYIIMDWEKKQVSIANANQAAEIGGGATTICGSSKKGSGSSHTGAIAGGVVGGVVGLALIAALAWFVWRRKQRNAKTGTAAAGAKVKDPSTFGDLGVADKAEMPQENAVDYKSPSESKGAIVAPAQELSGQHVTQEMPGTQQAPPTELPAKSERIIRSELPA